MSGAIIGASVGACRSMRSPDAMPNGIRRLGWAQRIPAYRGDGDGDSLDAMLGFAAPSPAYDAQNRPEAINPAIRPPKPPMSPMVAPSQQWMRSRRRIFAASTGSRAASSAWRRCRMRGCTTSV